MKRRDLISLILALVLGFISGFAVNSSLEGTAGQKDDDVSNARKADERVLYRVSIDDMEAYLLEGLDAESELYDQISANLEAMRDYQTFIARATDDAGKEAVIEDINVVLSSAYARVSDQTLETVEGVADVEVDDAEESLQIIIGEWSDPYVFEDAELQFYLKVPTNLADNLPKEWSEFQEDKPLETTIFWQNLQALPGLEA